MSSSSISPNQSIGFNVLKEGLPSKGSYNKKNAICGKVFSENIINLIGYQLICSYSKDQSFSSWVRIGTEVTLKEVFNADQALFKEISSKVDRAINLKSQKMRSQKDFKSFWEDNRESLICDILGTLILGPTATSVLLADFSLETENVKKHELLMRIKLSAKVVQQLHISQNEKKRWNSDFNSGVAQFYSESNLLQLPLKTKTFFVDRDQAIAASEFAAYHVLRSELSSLNGKSLKNVVCWKEIDFAYAISFQEALEKKNFSRDPSLNVCHIVAGTILASLGNHKKANQYFSQMLDSIEKLGNRNFPNLTSSLQKSAPSKNSYQTLFNFICEHAKNSEARSIAQEALKSDTNDMSKLIKSIKHLDLSGCYLDESELKKSNIHLLNELSYLDLSTNNLEKIPDFIEDFKYLKVLVINGNQLKEIPSFVSKMHNLNRLDILENPIRTVPSSLKGIVWNLPYLAKWV